MYEINVKYAWQVGLNDIDGVGINLDDNIIIPDDVGDAPVIKLMAWKEKKQRMF
jgi:hypothetical protein